MLKLSVPSTFIEDDQTGYQFTIMEAAMSYCSIIQDDCDTRHCSVCADNLALCATSSVGMTEHEVFLNTIGFCSCHECPVEYCPTLIRLNEERVYAAEIADMEVAEIRYYESGAFSECDDLPF